MISYLHSNVVISLVKWVYTLPMLKKFIVIYSIWFLKLDSFYRVMLNWIFKLDFKLGKMCKLRGGCLTKEEINLVKHYRYCTLYRFFQWYWWCQKHVSVVYTPIQFVPIVCRMWSMWISSKYMKFSKVRVYSRIKL